MSVLGAVYPKIDADEVVMPTPHRTHSQQGASARTEQCALRRVRQWDLSDPAAAVRRWYTHFPFAMWAVFLLAAITMSAAAPVHDDVDDVVAKEFHFHLYYFQTNNASSAYAAELVTRITAMSASMDTFIGVPLHLNTKPVGPHPVGSCEVWCPREYFARAYSWFALNRGPLSILIHPLTRHELRDHTDRAAWLGPSFRLDLSVLSPLLDKPPLQYPELHLGYSAPADAVTRVAMPI